MIKDCFILMMSTWGDCWGPSGFYFYFFVFGLFTNMKIWKQFEDVRFIFTPDFLNPAGFPHLLQSHVTDGTKYWHWEKCCMIVDMKIMLFLSFVLIFLSSEVELWSAEIWETGIVTNVFIVSQVTACFVLWGLMLLFEGLILGWIQESFTLCHSL